MTIFIGRRFIVGTNQKSSKFLLKQRIRAREYQHWIAKLMGYEFGIEYKKGLENSASDAPSRLPTAMELGLLSIVGDLNVAGFKKQVEEEEELNEIWKTL